METTTLAKEMEQHTYGIMNDVEDKHWWFVGRRAILESFLQDISQSIRIPNSAIRILDVGCGTGANLEMLKQYGDSEGVDVSDDALEFCRKKGLKVHKGLAEELPFENESFDLVTALDVVEHLDDDVAGGVHVNAAGIRRERVRFDAVVRSGHKDPASTVERAVVPRHQRTPIHSDPVAAVIDRSAVKDRRVSIAG